MLAAGATVVLLAGCGSASSSHSSLAAPSPPPAGSSVVTQRSVPPPAWCADAHALASEILSTTVLSGDAIQTWLTDATTLGNEIQKAGDVASPPVVGHGPAAKMNVALWASFEIRGAAIRAEAGKQVGLLPFQHFARAMAKGC
jgi:hypothetical protein